MPSSERRIRVTHHREPRYLSENTPPTETPMHADSSYTIKDEHRFVEKDDAKRRSGTLFTTEGQGLWLIQPPVYDMRLLQAETPYMLNGSGEELWRRQRCGNIIQERDLMHQRNQSFFSTNWDRLAEVFYESGVPKPSGLKRFTEVDLNDYTIQDAQHEDEPSITRTAGNVDFVGEGHDGQIVIVEFGKKARGKTLQLDRHTGGIEDIIKRNNHDDPELPTVSAYIGIYERNQQYQKVRLMGPRFYVPIVGSRESFYAAD